MTSPMVARPDPIQWYMDEVDGIEAVRLVAATRINGKPVILRAMRVHCADAIHKTGPFRPYSSNAKLDMRATAIPEYPGAWLTWIELDATEQDEQAIHDTESRPMVLRHDMPVKQTGQRRCDCKGGTHRKDCKRRLLPRDFAPPMPDGVPGCDLNGADGVWRDAYIDGLTGKDVTANPYQGQGRGRSAYSGVYFDGYSTGARERKRRLDAGEPISMHW